MSVLESVPDVGPGRCALVGVAKNCGKTTTLNALAAKQRALSRCVGILSIGVDGESRDALIGTPKPAIAVAEGELVVSASVALEMSTARFELADTLGYETPMGEALLARVVDPGEVVLAGVRHLDDLSGALEMLARHGAETILIDGAYGRVTAARADLCDRVVLATGAIVAADVPGIVRATRALALPLSLPVVEGDWRAELLAQAVRAKRVLVGGPSREPSPLSSASALVALRRDRGVFDEHTHAIAIPGLVSDAVAERLLGVPALPGGAPRSMLVPSGTSIQLGARLLGKLTSRWSCRVGAAPEIVAVSANPTSIAGSGVDRAALVEALTEALGVHVFDPRG